MCGISGIVNLNGDVPALGLLQRMGDRIAHRGPDDQGYYQDVGVGFCHRRLSISDLSERGHQPMTNEDGSLWLIYNGEIYNYEEIKKQLVTYGHRFRSDTDSEVVLQAYEEWGLDSLNKFNGMFAFAIWDSSKQRLFAARDRLGIKPFYYFYDGKMFVFSSEIKAILCHPDVSLNPNEDAIHEYLVLGHSYSYQTWYQGIQQLPPGSWLVLDNQGLQISKYWDVSFNLDYSRNLNSFVEELRELLKESIRAHLRSDVLVGAHLSGGIDSSSVVSLASRQLGKGFHTFSGAFMEGDDYDERSFIHLVSDACFTNHHETIPRPEELESELSRLIWFLDEPIVGPGAFSQFQVCRLISESGVKVVNGGQGGDELFAGYVPYYSLAVRNIFSSLKSNTFHGFPAEEYLQLPHYITRGSLMTSMARRLWPSNQRLVNSWLRFDEHIIPEMIQRSHDVTSDLRDITSFEKQTYRQLKYYLPALLQVEDRTSMAWSIESRVPLLDNRILELALKMPSWVKVRRGTLKYVLREAMRGIVPDTILDRQDKKGFPTPIANWFAGPLYPWVLKVLGQRPLLSEKYIYSQKLKDMLYDHASGRFDYSSQLWKVMNLELWLGGIQTEWKNVRSHLDKS